MLLYKLRKYHNINIDKEHTSKIKRLLLELDLSDTYELLINRYIIPLCIHIAKVRYTTSVKWDFDHWLYKEIIPYLSKIHKIINKNKKIDIKRLCDEINKENIIKEINSELLDYTLTDRIDFDYVFEKLDSLLRLLFNNRKKSFNIIKPRIIEFFEELRNENLSNNKQFSTKNKRFTF
jgi:hypothetical protein